MQYRLWVIVGMIFNIAMILAFTLGNRASHNSTSETANRNDSESINCDVITARIIRIVNTNGLPAMELDSTNGSPELRMYDRYGRIKIRTIASDKNASTIYYDRSGAEIVAIYVNDDLSSTDQLLSAGRIFLASGLGNRIELIATPYNVSGIHMVSSSSEYRLDIANSDVGSAITFSNNDMPGVSLSSFSNSSHIDIRSKNGGNVTLSSIEEGIFSISASSANSSNTFICSGSDNSSDIYLEKKLVDGTITIFDLVH